ncbi:hypothetical protein GCM10022226_02570 [Sphaerisporangium flaviroseum]|uniref:DUF4352 domain-containing protein n=1 Tax=Sphaerisporangium flaviroseum TaxID=509199 RepID=A0ABP7H9Y8_9ACTN
MNWRRNLGYGLGLLALIPAVVAAEVLPWREKYEFLTGKGGQEAVAAHGQGARVNGMEWRLKSITEGELQEEFSRPLPPRTKIAVVVISVKPLTDQGGKWFVTDGTCKIAATDKAGRIWQPSFRNDLAPKSPHSPTCRAFDANYNMVPLPVGKELTIQTEYVVPADAFPTLGVQIRLTPNPATVRLNP